MSNIQVTGILGRDAQARFTADGTAWLCVEIHQGCGSLAIVARRKFDTFAASAITVRHLAHHLREGSRVTVHAQRYDIEMQPTPHLVLKDVDRIEALTFAAKRLHQTDRAAA